MSLLSAITGDTTADNMKATKEFGEIVNSGRFADFNHVVAADCIDHDPAPEQVQGPDGYTQLFTMMKAAFPDLKVEVETQLAADDKVSFAYTLSGTQQGPFMGHPASGRRVKVRGMQIGRFADGKMVERWGSSDELGILKQIGALES